MNNESLNALLAKTEGLTEDFKAQVAPIFEEAVNAQVEIKLSERLEAEINQLNEKCESFMESQKNALNEKCEQFLTEQQQQIRDEYESQLQEQVDKVATLEEQLEVAQSEHEAMTEDYKAQVRSELESEYEENYRLFESRIDEYLNYVVEDFKSENEQALIESAQVEIAHNFMDGLKSLYQLSECEAPEISAEQQSRLEAVMEERDEVYAKLQDSLDRTMAMREELDKLKREKIMESYSHNLTDMDKERFRAIAESTHVPFDEFEDTVRNIAEAFYGKQHEPLETFITDSAVLSEEVSDKAVTNPIERLAKMMSNQNPHF